jgi:hypothetical protein
MSRKRPLIMIASTGLVTSLSWWQTLSVSGHSLVLLSAGGDPAAELVIASLTTEQDAQSLMNAVMDHMRYGARHFDARLWTSG